MLRRDRFALLGPGIVEAKGGTDLLGLEVNADGDSIIVLRAVSNRVSQCVSDVGIREAAFELDSAGNFTHCR